MSHDERADLLSQQATLQALLEETPPSEAIERASLGSRLKQIEEALSRLPPASRTPARTRITFSGKPVIGTHGIFSDFATKAIGGFSDAVSLIAASLSAPLAPSGPIPQKDRNQLLITRTAQGSFGFELEEYLPTQQEQTPPNLAHDTETERSPIAHALEQTRALLSATSGSDDELADSLQEIDRRALDKIRSFLQTLADGEATCDVRTDTATVAFESVEQVKRSIQRLNPASLQEEEEVVGSLEGVLPQSRLFEFKLSDSNEILKGRIAPQIAAPETLNASLHQRSRLRLLVTRVGSGRPRYLLLSPPSPLPLQGPPP